jgi:hypothetical protein
VDIQPFAIRPYFGQRSSQLSDDYEHCAKLRLSWQGLPWSVPIRFVAEEYTAPMIDHAESAKLTVVSWALAYDCSDAGSALIRLRQDP